MEWSLRPCTTTSTSTIVSDVVRSRAVVDRLTSLPDELLIRILSLLPTKDVAVTSVLSRRLRHVFHFITTLDFDISPISLCLKHLYAIERFPTFVAFVDNSLFAYKSNYLTKFRLRLSIDYITRFVDGCGSKSDWSETIDDLGCSRGCLPDLKSAQLCAWISFPLTRYGLRELDLCIIIKDPGDGQLPPAIFMCPTLEVLKLEVNLNLDQVSSMPSYCLPKLKLLHFCASAVRDNNFLQRLVCSCPLLEDVTFNVSTRHDHRAAIHSPSLRRLCLILYRDLPGPRGNFSDSVDFRTPNLEYLEYTDELALGYPIPIICSLVEAKLNILSESEGDSIVRIVQLLRLVSYVQRLTLSEYFSEELNCSEVKNQLPVFPNLNHLNLFCGICTFFWDDILLELLNCSPVLETLVFEQGLSEYFEEGNYDNYPEQLKAELDFFRAAHSIPSCCRYHLKRIVLNKYFGLQREVAIIQFFLSHSLVLEELVIFRAQEDDYPSSNGLSFPVPSIEDQMSVESAMKKLPRASATCSIKVL